MRHLALAFVIAALVSAGNVDEDDFDHDVAYETDFVQTSPMTELMDAVKTLRKHAPSHMSFHVNRVAKHAALIQSGDWGDDVMKKAKSYKHTFSASKAAIKSALSGLTNQLTTGHNHDKSALNSGFNAGKNAISTAASTGRNKTAGYKHKACPTKRHEDEADAKKRAAKSAMQSIQTTKMCSSGISETWKDMDVDKSSPKFGTQLRNKWDKARSNWLQAKAKYDAAVKAHKDAQTRHNLAMASFKTACKLEASNAHQACKNAHAEYATLKREIAGNVGMRKQVYIATLVVTCYIDNLTGNAAAKACADKQHGANTSRWNISPANLAACTSTSRLSDNFGPENWRPTSGSCTKEHWHGCNWKCYLARYSDLQRAFGNNLARAEDHWFRHGIKEGRKCTCPAKSSGPGTFNGNNCPSAYTQVEKTYCGHRYNGTKRKANGPVVKQLANACSADKNCKGFDMLNSANYGHTCKAPFKKTAYGIYKLCIKKSAEEDMTLVAEMENDMTEV